MRDEEEMVGGRRLLPLSLSLCVMKELYHYYPGLMMAAVDTIP
jgi:hypothetical protein